MKYRQTTVAVLLVAAFVANWLATPFLFSRHEHAWCDEHQQFEHIEHHDASGDHSHSEASHEAHITQSAVNVPPAADIALKTHVNWQPHPHDACYVLAQLNQKTNASAESIQASAFHTPDVICPTFGQNVSHSRSQLSQAPKNSPPRV